MEYEYISESVAEIATRYFLLNDSLEKLRDVKKDREGAVLGYISNYYEKARKSLEFFQKTSTELRKRLKIRDLEEELFLFTNTSIKL